jgi:hypothetical protein
MKSEDRNFPVYRKYKNNKSYFKILDSRNFEELQIIGTKVVLNNIKAISFPEINFIHDLIVNYSEMADNIDAKEFEEVKYKV